MVAYGKCNCGVTPDQRFMQDKIIVNHGFWWTHGCKLLSQFTNFQMCLMTLNGLQNTHLTLFTLTFKA